MDDDIQRMLADLGGARRDVVSAPCVDERGRLTHDDPQRQRAVLLEVEARRKKLAADSTSQDNSKKAVAAWNTMVIDDDEAANLENRYGGQGHRAGLAAALHRGGHDQWEALDVRFGEERRLYLQQQGGSVGRLSQPVAPLPLCAPCKPRRRDSAGSHRIFNTLLRGGPITARQSREGRPPSPRSHGTVRFGPGGGRRLTETAVATRATRPAPHLPTMLTPTVKLAQPAKNPLTDATNRTSAPRGRPSVPVPIQASTVQMEPGDAFIQAKINQARALRYAAVPDAECDKYYADYPEQLPLFMSARDQLIRESIELARVGNEQETKAYVSGHKERTWMVEAAYKVNHLVGKADESGIAAFEKADPRHGLFVKAGRAVFRTPTAQDTNNKNNAGAKSGAHSGISIQSNPPVRRDSGTSCAEAGVEQSAASATTTSATTPTPRQNGVDATKIAGTLAASFSNSLGELMGYHQIPLSIPVHVNITTLALSPCFDPRELVDAIEALGRSMNNCSRGWTMHTGNLAKARFTKGGLWEEVGSDDEDEVL